MKPETGCEQVAIRRCVERPSLAELCPTQYCQQFTNGPTHPLPYCCPLKKM